MSVSPSLLSKIGQSRLLPGLISCFLMGVAVVLLSTAGKPPADRSSSPAALGQQTSICDQASSSASMSACVSD